MNCKNCGSQNNTTSMYCSTNCAVMYQSKNACYCNPTERAFLNDLRVKAKIEKTKDGYALMWDHEFDGEQYRTRIHSTDFPGINIKELVNDGITQ